MYFDWILRLFKQAEPQSLHRAVMKNDEAAVQLALDKGADINERDKLGRTPLHIAIFRQVRPQCERRLLRQLSVTDMFRLR